MLDFLSNYQWDRPVNVLSMGGDLNIGIKEYLEYQGFSYKLVPIKNKTTSTVAGFVEPDRLYELMTDKFRWDAVKADNYFIDYQNYYTFLGVLSYRNLFVCAAEAFMKAGQNDRAVEMLDMCNEVMAQYPLETIPVGFPGNDYIVINMVKDYYLLGQADKARALPVLSLKTFFVRLLSILISMTGVRTSSRRQGITFMLLPRNSRKAEMPRCLPIWSDVSMK